MPPRALELTDRCAVQADDAQARKVKICHDRRIHCAQKLQFPGTDRFLQNPDGALVAWNDGPGFSDEDFKSIQNIGNSEKKSQAGKTGRFGVGFRAVYHITDLPSLVSANRVVFFDPQRRFLGKGPDGRRKGADIDFVNKPKGVQKYADQYEPYKMFGCDMVERFAGTLLRLPLRSKSEADSEHQELKKEACSADMVLALFDEFKQTAGSMLLFLQHVEEIELLVWEPGAPEPDLVFSTRIASSLDAEELEAMRAARSSMSAAGEAPGAACDDDEERGEVTCPVFTLAIETSDHSLDDEGSVQSVRWLVSQSAAEPGSEAELLAADSVQDELGMRLVSWGGVAAVVSGEAHDEDGGLQDLLQGRAYCTLPLPQFTGFPVHMNGFFELGENRCDICFGDDTIGEGKKKTDWNVALLRDCVVPAYARLIVHATEHEFKGADNRMDMLSRLFPTGSFEDKSKPWTAVPKELYARLCMQPVLLSTSGWLVCPSKALMADSESAGSMVDILSRSKRDIVDVSAARKLHEMFKRYVPEQITDVSPSCVRDMIREGEIDVQEATVLPVLEYCIRDCIRDQEWGHLVGLRLLPLPASAEAGRLDSFACSGSDEFHLCTPQELAMLTVSPARFVDPAIHGYPDLDDPDLDGVIYHALQSEAALSALNVRVFSSGDMIEMLNSEPGELYMGLEGVRLRRNLHPNECYERLHRTWDWILLNDCLKDAACLCVVPGTITGTEVLCSLDQAHLIDPDMFSKTPDMIDCLGMMGCASVDFGFFSSVFRDRAAATTALDSFLIHDEPTALLSCIHRWSKRGRYLDNPTTPEKHRKTLRDIVCRQDVVHAIGQHDEDDEDEDDVLRSLSLFRRHGADDSDYYSLDDGYLPPADVDRVLFPFVSEVLDLDTAALRLADALHAERMSVQKFFEKLVEKMGDVFSTKEELYSAALKFLVETATRSEVDCSLFDLLITQAIVPAGRGRGLVRVDSLYDIDSDSPFSRAKMHLPEHFPSWAFDASAGNSKTSMRLIHQLKMLRRHAQQRDPNSTVFQKVLTQTHALYVLDRILKQQDEDDFDLARDCIIQCVEFAIHSSEKIVHLPILVQRGSETKMCRADGDEPVFLNDTSFPCNNPNLWQVDERISKHFSANASRLMKVCSSETAGLQALSRDPTKLLSNVRSDQFGVSVNLVATIDSVLKKYQSCTIFKELLQNADDAGAEFVHFIHDHRESPFATDSLVHKDLADFMGPSLYAFNSAEFTEGNYEAICKIFESNKEADQTGQFGVGFTSAYHITDLPGFLTGDSLCIMDPLRVIFDQNGMRFPLSSTYEQCSSDFAPFCDMREFFRDDMHDPQNCEEKDKPFAGTMFRFPLRKTKGKIPSAKAMPNKEMDALMRQELVDSTDDIILFLKSVKRIRVSVIEAGALSPRKIFELRTIPVAVPVLPHVSRKRVEATRGDGHASACDWIISSTDEKLPVSVALNLSSDVSKDGRFYCLLPMPMISNLPVHVNAPFALDDSRSNMFMGSDSRDKRLKQNARIMQLSLPVAYLNLLDAVKTEVEVLSLFPCGLEGMLRTDFLPALYGHMTRSNAPALFPTTAAGDPHHIVYERAVFRDGSLDVACADSLEAAGMSLISIPEAVRCCLEQYAKKMRMITPGEVAMFLQALPEVKSSCVVHRAVTAGPLSQSLAEIEVQLSLCMYLNGCTLEQLDGIPLLPLCNDSYTVNGALAVVGNQVQDQTRVVQHNPKEDLLLRHCGGGINKLLLHHRLHNKLNFATFHIKRFDADVLIEHPPPPAFFGQESTPGFATLPGVEAVTTEDKGRRAWYLALWEWLEGEGGVLPDLPFPMLPTKQTGDGLVRVYRLSDRSKLLQPSGSRGDAEQAVEKILVACGCPVLDPARLSMVREVGQPFEYRAVLVALREQFRSAEAFKLSAEMSKKLLTFVANEVGRSAIPVEAAAILRELRLHESVWADPAAPDRGLLVSLESVSGRDVWILEEEPAALDAVRTAMGKLGAENASRQKFEASFLRCPAWDSNLRSLYVQLGVKPISLCEFCKRFAFVDEEDRLVYLHMLADQPQLLKLNGLKDTVKQLSWIRTGDGGATVKAGECFDERCDFYLRFVVDLLPDAPTTQYLLEKILKGAGFVDLENMLQKWHNLLDTAGRKSDKTVSYSDFSACMKAVSKMPERAAVSIDLTHALFKQIEHDANKSVTKDFQLRTYFGKSNAKAKLQQELLEAKIMGIKSIPTVQGCADSLCLEKSTCDSLCCLSDMVHSEHKSISDKHSLPPRFKLSDTALALIRSSPSGGLCVPSCTDVVRHLLNIAQQPHAGQEERDKFRESYTASLWFVSEHGVDEIEGVVSTVFKSEALVLMDDDCLQPIGKVFSELRRSFAPNFFSFPSKLKKPKLERGSGGPQRTQNNLVDLFRHFGMRDNPRLDEHPGVHASPGFGVTVKVVPAIRNVLRKYSKCSVFKELLQNADDAKAEHVHFLLDCRPAAAVSTEGWVHQKASCYMGPALYVFNSSVFSESDFSALATIFESQKTSAQTGKFGIGFTSVYQLSDFPGILSDGSIVVMDPREEVFDGRGMRFDSSNWQTFQNELQPFLSAREYFQRDVTDGEADTSGSFPGSLFRFPLRRKRDEINDLGGKEWSPTQVRQLMQDEILKEAENLILFLKHVSRIRVSVITAEGGSPEQIMEVSRSCEPVFESAELCRHVIRNNGVKRMWLVSQGPERDVSVAALFDPPEPIEGRAFCLLPLPLPTGLPVHINAAFELDDGRSNFFNTDDKSDPRFGRNANLMKSVESYVRLVEAFGLHSPVFQDDPCRIFSLFPLLTKLEGLVAKVLLPSFYSAVVQQRTTCVLPTLSSGRVQLVSFASGVLTTRPQEPDACLQALEEDGMQIVQAPAEIVHMFADVAKPEQPLAIKSALFLQKKTRASQIDKHVIAGRKVVPHSALAQFNSFGSVSIIRLMCKFFIECEYTDLESLPLVLTQNSDGSSFVAFVDKNESPAILLQQDRREIELSIISECRDGIGRLVVDEETPIEMIGVFNIKRFDADVLIEHPPPPAFFGQESTPGFATLPGVEAVTTEDKGRRAWYLALWEWLEGEGGVLPDLPFPMLPTKQTGDGLVRVYRLSDRSKLLQPSGSRGDAEQAVEKILVACGCPVLDPARLSMVREVGQPFEYRAVLVALREQFRSAEAFKLSAEMSKKLLTFVANEVGRSAIPVEAAAILRELRLHESVWADPAAPDRGLLVSLESVSGRDVWILEEEPAALDAVRTAMGKLGAENASRQKFEASFLRCPAWDSNLRSLYVQLGVKPISLCEFCKRFAFVDEEDRLVYLHMLADQPQLLKLNGLSELVHELSFIPSTDGFAVASKCFDERCDFYLRFASPLMGGSAVTTVGLFMDLEEQGLLVDGARGRWVVFLNANGRKHDQATISYDDYASCMRIIAEHGRVQPIAFELVADVFAKIGRDSASKPDKKLKSATAKSGRWFCMKMEQCGLAKIECIPAISSSLASAVPALETDACDELHCLANLVHWQDSSVCWTVRPSLPNDAFDLHPSALDAIRTVGGLETPSVKDVIEHLENVGNHFAESRSSLDPQDPHNPHSLAVTDIYVWLSRELDQPTDDQTAALHDLRERAPPLVLLESGEFVASRVVFFGLAKSGATAQAAMQATAMQATACPPHFCDFPECWIEQAAMFKLMGVCKAPNAEDLLFTIRSIQERRGVDPLDPNEIEASRISLTSLLQDDTWSEDGPVYFLDDTFRLRPVSEICVQDDPRWASRVSGTVHFIDTDLLHVIASNSRAFGRATDLGLQFLSRLVDERLVPPAPAHYLPAGSKAEAEEVLGSDAFKRALLRIHAHERPWHSGDVEKRVLQKIEAIRHCSLVPVSTIMTRIVAKDTGEELSQPTGADHSQDERDTHRKVFGDLENQRILVVPSAEGFGTALAREVNRLLDGLVTNELFLQIAVGTYPPERITAALGECGVPESTDGYGAFGLGLPLLDHHHACLSQDIGEHFSAGEFVAYLRQEDLRQEAFVYARVVTHAVGTGRLDARLELTVNQSGATEQVSSLYVYKFDGDTSRAIHEEMAIVAVGEVQDAPAETDLDGRPCDDDETENLTLREKLLEVCELLREALSLGDREKKQVLRRLYLRWHPDKNPDDKADCTEVFKYLKACIDADRILPLPGEAQPPGNGFGAPPSDGGGGFAGAGGGFGGGGFGGAGGGFGEQYNEWESYARRAGQAHGRHEQRSPPDPAASRRWAEQAVSDTHAARVLLQSECWSQCCFYSHQALEVALKAALFRTPSHTSNMLTHHRITEFAQLLHDAELGAPDVRAEAGELQQYYIASRYPNARENHGSSPSARLGRDQATDAFSATQGAVQRLQAFL